MLPILLKEGEIKLASREGENQEQILSVKCNFFSIPTLWNIIWYKMSAGQEELLMTDCNCAYKYSCSCVKAGT